MITDKEKTQRKRMSEKLQKLRKDFISDKPFKKTNKDKLFEKAREFEKRLKILEKELDKSKKDFERANNFIRKYIPAFPSLDNKINLEYIKDLIDKELKKKTTKRKTAQSKTKRPRYRLNFELIYGKKKKRKTK